MSSGVGEERRLDLTQKGISLDFPLYIHAILPYQLRIVREFRSFTLAREGIARPILPPWSELNGEVITQQFGDPQLLGEGGDILL